MIQKICFGLVSLIALASNLAQSQEISLMLVNDTSIVASGGLKEGVVSRSLAAADIAFVFGNNYTLFAQVQAQRGDNGSDFVGDIQAFSNIDEDDFNKLYELWFSGEFTSLGLGFKLGKVDANSEFAFVDHAGEFINSSMGFSPTIAFLPTYPSPTASINVFYEVDNKSLFKVGLYSDESNRFDEQFVAAEWRFTHNETIFKLGAWKQSGQIQRLDSIEVMREGTSGYYFVTEGQLALNWFSASNVGWYVHAGISDGSVSEIDRHGGAGVIFYDVFSDEGNSAGLGLTYIETSTYLRSELNKDETALELFYKYQVNEFLSFKPDLQFIISPASDITAADALVFTLRTEFTF